MNETMAFPDVLGDSKKIASGVLVRFDRSGANVRARAGLGGNVDFWGMTMVEEYRIRKAAGELVDKGLVAEGSSYLGVFFDESDELLGISSCAVEDLDSVHDEDAWEELAASVAEGGSDDKYADCGDWLIVAFSRGAVSRISSDNDWLSQTLASEITSSGIDVLHVLHGADFELGDKVFELAGALQGLRAGRVRWVSARQEGEDTEFDYSTSVRGSAHTRSVVLEIADGLVSRFGTSGDVVIVSDADTGRFAVVQFDGFHPLGVDAAGCQAVVESMWDEVSFKAKMDAANTTQFYKKASEGKLV